MVRTDIAFVLLLPFASIDEGNWSLVNSPRLDVSVMLSTDQTARSNVQPVRTKNVSPLRLKLKWAAALCLLLDVLSCFLYSATPPSGNQIMASLRGRLTGKETRRKL
jgi:hypothetical protein